MMAVVNRTDSRLSDAMRFQSHRFILQNADDDSEIKWETNEANGTITKSIPGFFTVSSFV